MNIRRFFSTAAAGAAIVLGVTACGGASNTSSAWFTTLCTGMQAMQSGDFSTAGQVSADLKALPAPDVEGGQAFADAMTTLLDGLANPEGPDLEALASMGDMTQFRENSALEAAARDTPECAPLFAT